MEVNKAVKALLETKHNIGAGPYITLLCLHKRNGGDDFNSQSSLGVGPPEELAYGRG